LQKVLERLPTEDDPRVLVGSSTADDAAVFLLRKGLALVQTVDFFTPIVDDPYTYGQIAAANALSDVYAMGGTPLTALNLIGIPVDKVPTDVVVKIVKGGADKAREAGVAVVGGHSIRNPEPVYGMSVTGVVNPKNLVTNAAAKPGDMLILTKPIGTGVITTGIKQRKLDVRDAKDAIEAMCRLNKNASETMVAEGVKAATDVTGFGLLGHLREMCDAGDVAVEVYVHKVPLLKNAREMAEKGAIPGGTRDNLKYVSPVTEFDAGVGDVERILLADAQTSGGLLIGQSAKKTEKLCMALIRNWVKPVALIGRFVEKKKGGPTLRVLP
jgi:selenide,water dikinase